MLFLCFCFGEGVFASFYFSLNLLFFLFYSLKSFFGEPRFLTFLVLFLDLFTFFRGCLGLVLVFSLDTTTGKGWGSSSM